jgi:hypothetical protein
MKPCVIAEDSKATVSPLLQKLDDLLGDSRLTASPSTEKSDYLNFRISLDSADDRLSDTSMGVEEIVIRWNIANEFYFRRA